MALSRRNFLGGIAAPLLAQKKAEAPARPNVVLIMADDLAAWMLGCYGNKEIRTPNIDLLARTGTRFVNSYCVTPAGSASRATLLTGRLPWQHGIQDSLADKPVENPPSFAGEIMISDILAGEGYRCGYAGNWDMGDNARPQHKNDFWYTIAGGPASYQDPRMSRNGEIVQEKGYLAELITARASEFLDQQQAGTPFFLTVSHFNPHVPYDGHPQKYYDLYAQATFETIGWQPAAPNALREKEMLKDAVGNIRKCAAAVTAFDDQVGALMRKLRDRQLLDNTIVVFTAGNGFLLGRHGLWSNGLASDPINMYEEVMQVPMIWSWLGKVPAENTRPELISFYDFLPTICEATGAPVPAGRNLCGRSYLPLARNQRLSKKQAWRNLLFGYYRNTAMVRDARYKEVVRNGGKGPNELYDLRTDAREALNQYANPQFITVRDRLRQDLDAWRKKYGAPA